MSLAWWWTEVGSSTVAKIKKDCVLADTVYGVEIWRSQGGYTRLSPVGSKTEMSNRIFFSIKEAKEAILYMS